MSKTVVVLATMDTKGAEAGFLREELAGLGAQSLLMDIGVVGDPDIPVDVSKASVAAAGGGDMDAILKNPTRGDATPIMIRGAIALLKEKVESGAIHAVIALGGTQGTSTCAEILQALPYGFPKVIFSTVASGDTSKFVDIKDIVMVPAVSDILGLNPFSRKMLANLAGIAYGMASIERKVDVSGDVKGVIGMTNLGVLTKGTMRAMKRFEDAGYEVIVFHAVGSGGRAMEQMMKEGLITAVFDYAMGEIADGEFGGLRAANDERLTVAGKLGLPQLICPGGSEHLGIWVDEPNQVPDTYKDHTHVFHSPFIFVPRLKAEEFKKVAATIIDRLSHTQGDCTFLIPTQGVSRYSTPGGELIDAESDAAFFDALEAGLPDTVKVQRLDYGIEDPEFVDQAVDALIELIANKKGDGA